MIGPASNTQIRIAAGVTDLRRGFDGLSALVQTKLEKSPLSRQALIFRGRSYRCYWKALIGGDRSALGIHS
jgi:transposase